jgi:hypothetical protein
MSTAVIILIALGAIGNAAILLRTAARVPDRTATRQCCTEDSRRIRTAVNIGKTAIEMVEMELK